MSSAAHLDLPLVIEEMSHADALEIVGWRYQANIRSMTETLINATRPSFSMPTCAKGCTSRCTADAAHSSDSCS
jgi:hypothetical protein